MSTNEKNPKAILKQIVSNLPLAVRHVGEEEWLISFDFGRSNPIAIVLRSSASGLTAHRLDVKSMDMDQFVIDQKLDSSSEISLSKGLDWFGLRGSSSGYSQAVHDRWFSERIEGFDAESVKKLADNILSVSGAEQFKSHVNMAAIDSLKCIDLFDASVYRFYALDGERGVFRRQAASTCPIFASDMSTKVSVKLAIDGKKPLIDVMERAYGAKDDGSPRLTKSLLKKLRNADSRRVHHRLDMFIDVLSQIPVDWVPSDREELNNLFEIVDHVLKPFQSLSSGCVPALVSGARGKWSEFRVRIAKAAASTLPPDDLSPEEKVRWRPSADISIEGLKNHVDGAMDMFYCFRDKLIMPAAAMIVGRNEHFVVGAEARRVASDVAFSLLFGDKSLVSIMESQRDWHADLNDYFAIFGDSMSVVQASEDGWVALTGEYVAPNGIHIVPMTEPSELVEESRRLNHCVGRGSYDSKAKKGDCHLYSLRHENDGKLSSTSTVEFGRVDLTSRDQKLHVLQHRAHTNGAPSREDTEALKWFMSEVERGMICLDLSSLAAFLKNERIPTDEVSHGAGYDRNHHETIDAMWSYWKKYLPRNFSSMSLSDFVSSDEMNPLVDIFRPSVLLRSKAV